MWQEARIGSKKFSFVRPARRRVHRSRHEHGPADEPGVGLEAWRIGAVRRAVDLHAVAGAATDRIDDEQRNERDRAERTTPIQVLTTTI